MHIDIELIGNEIVLRNMEDNFCFASFTSKDVSSFGYLKRIYDTEQKYINRYQDLSLLELNQLHYDLSKEQSDANNLIEKMNIGDEMKHITNIYKSKFEKE